jgi:hypothetical protein
LHLFTWEKSLYLLTLPRFEKIKKLEAEIILFCENSQTPETRGTSILKIFERGFQKHSTKDP